MLRILIFHNENVKNYEQIVKENVNWNLHIDFLSILLQSAKLHFLSSIPSLISCEGSTLTNLGLLGLLIKEDNSYMVLILNFSGLHVCITHSCTKFQLNLKIL